MVLKNKAQLILACPYVKHYVGIAVSVSTEIGYMYVSYAKDYVGFAVSVSTEIGYMFVECTMILAI